MPVCVFDGCLSGSKKKNIKKVNNVHLHKFPKDPILRKKWLHQIKKGNAIKKFNIEKGKFELYFVELLKSHLVSNIASKYFHSYILVHIFFILKIFSLYIKYIHYNKWIWVYEMITRGKGK